MSNSNWLWCIVGAWPILAAVGCASHGPDSGPVQQRAGFVRSLPEVQEPTRLLGKEDTVSMRSGLVILQPGQDCGWHSTENYEELIICLEGSGELASEGAARRPLAAGQYAYNPPQTRHNVFNTGTAAMRYIYVVSPAVAPPGGHKH